MDSLDRLGFVSFHRTDADSFFVVGHSDFGGWGVVELNFFLLVSGCSDGVSVLVH